MRTTRLLGALAAATLAAVGPLSSAIAAAAEDSGVGTGSVSSTLLSVEVGDGLLSVSVLADDGSSTIDPANGDPVASTSVTPLTISSTAVPALNVSTPSVTTSSSGAEDRKDVAPALPSVPAFSGGIAGTLSSIVDSAGARSGLDATVNDLLLAGSLLSVPSGAVTLATDAATGEAKATRSISIPAIEVLNLAAVLEGAGVALQDLPLDDLLGLLAGLGIVLPELPDPGAVIETVNGALDSLQGVVGDLTAEVCNQVDDLLGTVGGLVGTGTLGTVADQLTDAIAGIGGTGGTPGLPALPGLPLPIPIPDLGLLQAQALPVSCDAVTGTVQDLVDDLQGVVANVVTTVLEALDQTSLLSVQGIELGLVADAKSSVEQSVAEVTGTIGSVKVGARSVPGVSGLDLTAAADALEAAGDTVSAAVGEVLGVVSAPLASMVDVDMLRIDELVGADGGYANASAAVTALTAKITPPGLLTGALDLGGTASDLLAEASAAVPALAPVMAQLEAALGGLDVLTAPTTITVGQLSSSSSFRPVAASVPATGSTPPGSTPSGATPSGDLPRTGSDAAVPAIAAVLVAGVALGIRRFVAAIVAP